MVFKNKEIYVDFDNTLCLWKVPASRVYSEEVAYKATDKNGLEVWTRDFYNETDCVLNTVLVDFLSECKNNGCTITLLTNETWPFKVEAKKLWLSQKAPELIDSTIRLSSSAVKSDYLKDAHTDLKDIVLIDDKYAEQIKPALSVGICAYTVQYIMMEYIKGGI